MFRKRVPHTKKDSILLHVAEHGIHNLDTTHSAYGWKASRVLGSQSNQSHLFLSSN